MWRQDGGCGVWEEGIIEGTRNSECGMRNEMQLRNARKERKGDGMRCSECGYDMLDARLSGMCGICEEKQKKKDVWQPIVFLTLLVIGILCSIAWSVMKFLAVLKWLRT